MASDNPAFASVEMETPEGSAGSPALVDAKEKTQRNHERHRTSAAKNRLRKSQGLHGRPAEKAKLLEAYHLAQKEELRSKLVIIKGSSGSGKTALAKSLQAQICQDRGHMMTWRFDKQTMLQVVPGFRACLEKMFGDILSRSEKEIDIIKLWLRPQFDAVQVASLISMSPPLAKLFDIEDGQLIPPEKAYRNSWSSFRKFMMAVCSVEFPVVYLFDDLHCIDDSTLSWCMQGLLNVDVHGALFVVTYNSDLEDSNGKWYKKLESFRTNESIDVFDIHVDNLDNHSTNSMVTEMLGQQDDASNVIATWVHRQSRGNPLYIEELLLRMCQIGLLYYRTTENIWHFDEEKTHERWTGLGNVCEFLASELQRFPEPLQEVLKVGASLGCRFNPELVASVLSDSVAEHLAAAKKSEVLFDVRAGSDECLLCGFVHNAMHEAALTLVGDSVDQEVFHLEIGSKLVQVLSDKELKDDLLTITGQVMYGANHIRGENGHYGYARLALAATQTLVNYTSFQSAAKTVSFAISLLGSKSWREEYDLTLALYNAGAEIAYANGRFEIVEELTDVVLRNARSFDDKLQANATRLYMMGSSVQADEAFCLGLGLLKELGETFPKKPRRFHVAMGFSKTRRILRSKSDEALLRMPIMRDGKKVAAMQIMNVLFSTAYVARPMLAPLMAFRMVHLSLEHGLCEISAVAFSVYGMMLCNDGGRVTEGTRFGDLALKMLDRFQTKQWVPRVYAAVYGFIDCWNKPIQSTFPHLLNGYRIALETGDIVFAVINAVLYIFYLFDTGKPIKEVEIERCSLVEDITNRHQQVPDLLQSAVVLMLHKLLGRDTNGFRESDDGFGWALHQMAIVAYIHRDYEVAVDYAVKARQRVLFRGVDFALFYMVEGLANLALFKQTGRRNYLLVSLARRRIAKLNRFAKHAMEYCLGRLLLLQAELSSLSPWHRHHDAIRKYTSAIALANARGSLLDEAIAQECYGRYLEERGNNMGSLSHLRLAYSLYLEWNAYPKADRLRAEINEKAGALDAGVPFSAPHDNIK